ncbi:hypothetical protein B0H11DRAFT_1639326, partial [Mycena galericulata]
KKKKRSIVNWIKNPNWTDKLIEYLVDDPRFRIKLFSDSTAEAKKAGRQKLVGKDGKTHQYTQLAAYIFKEDPAEEARYANAPKKYASAVETRLKKEYLALCTKLGATGAGLDPGLVTAGTENYYILSRIYRLFSAEIRNDWPWWDQLHGFWRELPNYNPVGVQSSEPGTDHAGAASALYSNQPG